MVNPPIIPILSPQCHFAGLLVPAGVVFSCVTKTTWSPAMSSSSGSQGTRLQASIGSCFPCCFRFPIACTLNSYTPYPKIHNTRPNLPTPICVAGYITNSRDVASSNKTPTFSETPSSIYIYIHTYKDHFTKSRVPMLRYGRWKGQSLEHFDVIFSWIAQ